MTTATRGTTIIRGCMMLCGGLLGAWTGGGGALQLPQNADGFGTLFAQGFFLGFAFIGFFTGAFAGALMVTAVEAILRRLGVGAPITAAVAIGVTLLWLWLLHDAVLVRYPGLRAEKRTAEGWHPESNPNATLLHSAMAAVSQPSSNRSSIITLSHAFTKA